MANGKLRVGVAGLGRMGKRHATNFHNLTPRATVVAASSPVAEERKWAEENISGIKVYSDFGAMLDSGNVDAIVVASATSVHAEQTLLALQKGYHVLCEKPLSLDLALANSVLSAYKTSLETRPAQKVMCGFSRRFDASYREAAEKLNSGVYGDAVVFRSQTADMHDTTGFFVEYAKNSGGIFVDCSIHDIDLMLWFMGEDRQIKSLQAVGVTAVHPELENDADNAVATVEFDGGKIANLYCSRMMAAGQEDTTEIICHKGSLRVNMHGSKNRVEVHDAHGARRELPKHYYERFIEAFVTESNAFTDCCLDNTDVPIKLETSVRAIAIGQALQQSLVTGQKAFYDKIEPRL